MPDVGTLQHYLAHRGEYLTRVQAAARIGKTRRTIENYIGAGLPVHEPLPGVERIHVDELLAMWRSKMTRQRGTRFQRTAV